MESLSPEELVRWCQRTLPEDSRAFEYLVNQYKSRVFATSYRLMGNRQEAEDQAQEVFLKIYRNIQRLDDPATLPAWITRITVNTCLDALTRQKRRPQTLPLSPPTPDGEEEPHYADTTLPTPEEALLNAEQRRCVETTMARLDADTRAVLVLRDLDDRPYQEIAGLLSVSLSAVKMRIHRARLSFQQMLLRVCPDVARLYQLQTSPQAVSGARGAPQS
ncbi:MAG: sigma-70 family RNA polymerase sigma factor [Chloroflexaceae bacterium]|nr:sigma-70 family RNA polymerase sigma factor [Chloroflexaceae bacterium]